MRLPNALIRHDPEGIDHADNCAQEAKESKKEAKKTKHLGETKPDSVKEELKKDKETIDE